MEKAAWCRAQAIERMQEVNDLCFDALRDDNGRIDRDALKGFFDSAAELDRLSNVASEVEEDRAKRYPTEEDTGMAALMRSYRAFSEG